MIDKQDASRLEALFEVANSLLVLPLIPEPVHQVGKGVAQANDGIETILNVLLNVVVQCQPVGFLNDCRITIDIDTGLSLLIIAQLTPLIEGSFLSPGPALLEGVLQHLIRGIYGHNFEALLHKHQGVHTERKVLKIRAQ